jgi:predicted SAM-dependent methyltransferase
MNTKEHLAIKLIAQHQWTDLTVDEVQAEIKSWHPVELPDGTKRLAIEAGFQWYLIDNRAPRDQNGELILG